MATPLLTTELDVPSVRPDLSAAPSTSLRAGLRTRLVPRPRLIERLNAGLDRELTPMRSIGLVSAQAGFGKTTLLSERECVKHLVA